MPPRLTKPAHVPDSREPLVNLLWRFYIAAGRPPTRRVAEVIESWDDDQRTGTANHETVRRTLRGDVLGALQTVEVIFRALCELADVDPDDADDPDDSYDSRWSSPPAAHIALLRQYWNQAIDDSPTFDNPKTRKDRAAEQAVSQRPVARPPADDPWSTAPPYSGPSADEPPF